MLRLKGRFMVLIMAQVWRRRSKRFCDKPGDYSQRFRNRARYMLSVSVAISCHEFIEQKALKKLKPFLIDNFQIWNLTRKGRNMYKSLTYM